MLQIVVTFTDDSRGVIYDCNIFIKQTTDVDKNDIIQGAGKLGKHDVTWGQANSTFMPPNKKSKQSRATDLSFKKKLGCRWMYGFC